RSTLFPYTTLFRSDGPWRALNGEATRAQCANKQVGYTKRTPVCGALLQNHGVLRIDLVRDARHKLADGMARMLDHPWICWPTGSQRLDHFPRFFQARFRANNSKCSAGKIAGIRYTLTGTPRLPT